MAASYPPVPHRERPLGVAILAVLIGLFAALLLLASIVLFLFGAPFLGAPGVGFGGGAHLTAVVLLLLAIILFVVASGLWDLRLWALVLSIIVVGFLWISDALTGHLFTVTALIELLLLIYLVLVRRHFE